MTASAALIQIHGLRWWSVGCDSAAISPPSCGVSGALG
jgi:hypothetical protein